MGFTYIRAGMNLEFSVDLFFLRVGLKSRRCCKIIIRTERLDFSLGFARETDTVATLVMSEIQCGWRGNFYLVLHSQILSPLLMQFV
ncbi:hypothetical protein NC652_031792 [Populus alba x Populus x berolinensis]|nr:hypothetical protein NC652_031792 [Populus alba x Populus x berolinensis]